jgi:Tol biopolymer transport system component
LGSGATHPSPHLVLDVEGASHVQVSPDGSRLAFDDGSSTYVADVDGWPLRRVGPANELAVTPAWSPDGRSLVVTGPGDVLSMLDLVTGRRTEVLRAPGGVWFPNVSPDGRAILFTTVRHGEMQLRTVPVGGGRSTLLRKGAFGSYSPDGSMIAFRHTDYDGLDATLMTGMAVLLSDADGRHPHRLGGDVRDLSRRDIDIDAGSQIDPMRLWPRWSPDGTRIAYEPVAVVRDYGIFAIDATTGERRRISDGHDPSWFNDETVIVTRD